MLRQVQSVDGEGSPRAWGNRQFWVRREASRAAAEVQVLRLGPCHWVLEPPARDLVPPPLDTRTKAVPAGVEQPTGPCCLQVPS